MINIDNRYCCGYVERSSKCDSWHLVVDKYLNGDCVMNWEVIYDDILCNCLHFGLSSRVFDPWHYCWNGWAQNILMWCNVEI